MSCPNTNLEEWKLLVASRGEDVAYALWDLYDGNVPESESKQEIVKSGLKATNILQSPKADQFFNAVAKNKISGDFFWKKMQADLGIPKDQIEILKSFDTQDKGELISSLLANYSFAIEINTATQQLPIDDQTRYYQDGNKYYSEDPYDGKQEISFEEYERYRPNLTANSQYYSNMTVPGGTNYTENEIATPAITPSIKGHAQFATDQGIGWFRSDEQTIPEIVNEDQYIDILGTKQLVYKKGDITDTQITNSKTRRILEVQSDLFQKGRDSKKLTSNLPKGTIFQTYNETWEVLDFKNNLYTLKNIKNNEVREYTKDKLDNLLNVVKEKEGAYNLEKIGKDNKNQFLQLLNQGSNWVTFFVKSIIQDSAKKGYEKVLFPSGNTASKVEGHTTLEDFKKQKEDRIKNLQEDNKKLDLDIKEKGFINSELERQVLSDNEYEIKRLKEEIERVEKEGFAALRPIYNFYENTVKNVLNKQYGKENVKQVTDEYGNTWNEINIVPEREQQSIYFQTNNVPASRASKETIEKIKKIAENAGISFEELKDYLKGNPEVTATDINGLADIMKGIIAIAEGKEDVALTEEFVHVASAIVNQTNPKLITEMISKIDRFKIYQKVLKEYSKDPNYQTKDGKPDIRKIKKEAVDKLISELIIKQSEGSTEFPELTEEINRSMIRRFWEAILDIFRLQYKKANINIFETASELISSGNLGARYMNNIKPGVQKIFNNNSELSNIGTPQQYSTYLDSKFPNTKAKDVVYHGTGESTKIETFNARDGRIYFSDDLTASQYANWDEFNRTQNDPFSNPKAQVVPAIINLENPVILDGVDFKETETNKEGDGIIGLNIKDPLGGIENQYVVRSSEQTLVLGSEEDLQGFRNFVENGVVEFKPTQSDIFLQKAQKEYTPAQLELQQKIQTTKEQIFKRTNENEKVDPILLDTEEASNFYEVRQPDGTFEKVTKRVTDRVKAWYKKRFGNKEFSEAQKEFNELKRELGVKFHYFFEDVHARYFNVDGTRRESVGKRNVKLDVLDDAAYDKIENYFVNLVEEFSKDGKNPLVFSEVVVYDPKEKEAGTIDLLIVDEDGKANIFDWKFMSISESATDVPWFKQGAFGIQLGRYKDILKDAYGVKEIGMNRAIPILMEFRKINPKDKNSKLQIKGINVGSVDTSQIEDLRLVPVSEETESTGDKRLDKLLKELNAIYRQISSKDATSDEEREFKRERMNLLKQAIRSAQSSQDISPMIDVIKVMRREGEQIINDWETIYSKRPASDKDLDNNELSDYADNIREYIAISQVFSKIDDLIGNLIYNKEMEQDAVTKEQKEEIAFRKSILDEIRDEKSKISNSRDEVVDIAGKFADKFMGERNLVKGLLSPQAVWKSLGSYFRGASESPLASVKVLFKLVTNARGKASSDANGLIDELLNIRKTLSDRGGNLRELVKKIYQKDSDNKIVNKLIYKYKKDFYTGVDDNAIEGKQEKSWLLKNINVDEYKKEALEMMNKRIKSINSLYSENEDLRDELILEERRKWDISRLDFNGWNNYIIKRHPSDIWLSEEYKELQNDPELLKLYNFISSVNDQATDVGYIQNKIHSTFLPFVRKSMAESIAWDFSLSTIMNFGKSLELNADDVGYGSINELTNELEHSIPKYYTTDFTKKENGEVDYTDVSEDLFKNMILYINHMQKYKYLSEVEGQLNLVKTVEGFKSHYETTRGGDIVMENGKPKEASGNVDNQKIFDDFLRALLYEEKYPLSSADTGLNVSVRNFMKKAINKVANKEVFPVEENPSAKSLVKVMDATNRAFQLKTLGFEIISGAVNAFGGNIQIATQAGNYFKAREVLKNEADLLANRFKSEDEREMFIQLINTFMPLKDDPSYDKLKKAGMSKLTRANFSDMLMVFMRYPEQHIEKSLFKTLLDNTMVIDGKLVNIREYVKSKYKDRYSSAEAYKDSKSKIEDEIQELKQTSSISSTKKLEDGKLVIPGFDLNNRDEIQNLTNLARRIARNATGGIADADLNRMQMSIWTKSMMVFKNWIPKLVDTRFGEFRKISDDFSVEIDENGMTTGEKYDVGRVRLLIPFISFNIVKTIKEINDVISVTDAGISKLDALYNKYAEDYKNKTGQDLTMSKEDFNDLIITNLRNQIKELGILLSLFGAAFALGLLSPDDDDDDKATKNAHRYAQKVVDKFIGELSFFYNPLEVQKLLSGSAFPAIGLFSDVTRFVSHTSMEWTGIDVSDFDKSPEEVRKKAQPIKNLGKMLPLTKSLITYLAIFDSDFAKEYDVTIQKESNK
jgi:hypothetical protein